MSRCVARAAAARRRLMTGFTLLEVLVALAVFAVSAAAVMRQTHLGLAQQLALEQRTTALWLAENRLTTLAVSAAQAPLGRVVEEVTQADLVWRVTTEVGTTALAQLRRIEVAVVPVTDETDSNDYAMVRLVTFQGEP